MKNERRTQKTGGGEKEKKDTKSGGKIHIRWLQPWLTPSCKQPLQRIETPSICFYLFRHRCFFLTTTAQEGNVTKSFGQIEIFN